MHRSLRCLLAYGLMTVMFLSGTGQTCEIQAVTDPPLGSTNRLHNPDFADGETGPLHWRFVTSRSDLLQGSWSEDALSEKSLRISAGSGEMSGYWGQDGIAMVPEEHLVFSTVVKMKQGRILLYVIGFDDREEARRQVYDDRRLYLNSAFEHPLYPVFVKGEQLKELVSAEWDRQRLIFRNSRDATQAHARFGLYFSSTPGEVWFDRAYFGIPTVELDLQVRGENIGRVEVYDDFGRLLLDSLALSGVQSWSRQVQIPADIAYCTIRVSESDGRVFSFQHP